MHPFFWPRHVACAHLVLTLGCLLAGAAGAAGAQGVPSAADPEVPVPAVPWSSTLAGVPKGIKAASGDWRQANAAVAEFPRGHSDILQWETRPAPGREATAPAAPIESKTIAPHVPSTSGKP